MSTETGEDGKGPSPPTHITLERSVDGEMWVVTDKETGVTTQGESREHALEMLDEAVAPHKGDGGDPVTDNALREWGIDPEAVPDGPEPPEVPWFDDNEE